MLFKRVLFLSVFFRGFRGHNIRHHQIETVPGPVNTGMAVATAAIFLQARAVGTTKPLSSRLALPGLISGRNAAIIHVLTGPR
jgi:hypothetical protein